VQYAGLVHPVDNPEHILQKKARLVVKRRRASMETTFEMSELSEWPTPILGSPLDVELNPFLDTSAEQIRPIIPGRSSLSSVCVIPEESLEELISEVMQALSDKLTSLPPSRTSILLFNNSATTQQAVSLYSPAKGSRAIYCLEKNPQSKIRGVRSGSQVIRRGAVSSFHFYYL